MDGNSSYDWAAQSACVRLRSWGGESLGESEYTRCVGGTYTEKDFFASLVSWCEWGCFRPDIRHAWDSERPVQVPVWQKINIFINIVSKKRHNMWSTGAQTETSGRSPSSPPRSPGQAQQKPPGAQPPPPPPHRFHLAAAPPSSHWVNLWLSDLHSSLMDAIRKGVSLKKVEDEGKYAVEETTPGMLQRALSRRLSAC